ncbi:MAG: prepilin-type N-terminal cleavage/methylation domain-containing protein [Deltaproteobacteria bacterium]|nr:prepilin-type N-terminal cleavage/methylation domain-containing protein [Deltaproteobacteria bacterium]
MKIILKEPRSASSSSAISQSGAAIGSALSGSRPSGFTLIEVLVAIVLISFGCLAAGTMQISAMKAKIAADNVTVASFLVESELEKLKTLSFNDLTHQKDYQVANLSRLGMPCPGPCQGVSFSRAVKFYKGNPTSLSYHVEVEVAWRDSTGQKSLRRGAILTGTTFI